MLLGSFNRRAPRLELGTRGPEPSASIRSCFHAGPAIWYLGVCDIGGGVIGVLIMRGSYCVGVSLGVPLFS